MHFTRIARIMEDSNESSEWLRYLTADRLVRVQELSRANKCMHQSSLIKLTVHIKNLHRVTELNLDPYR